MAETDRARAGPGRVLAHGTTHAGRVRTTNEDAFHCDVECGVYILADGMGGHASGEIASRMAIDVIRDFLEGSRDDADVTWPFGVDAALSHDGNRVLTAILLANRRVFQTASWHQEYAGMGTTAVAAVVTGDLVTFGSVGDSRLYLARDGRLDQLTQDDTWVATVLSQNAETDPALLESHPLRHVLTEAVGTGETAAVAVQQHRLEPGHVLLMCSDGLHGSLPDAELLRLLQLPGSAAPDRACAALLDAALAVGARDNVTAVVLRRC